MIIKLDEIEFSKSKCFPKKDDITLNLNCNLEHDFCENEIVQVSTPKGKKTGMISFYKYKNSNIKAYMSREFKALAQGEFFSVEKTNHIDLTEYSTAKISNIKKNKIGISNNIIQQIMTDNKPLDGILLLNKLNGCILNVPIDRVELDYKSENKVELNVKDRRLLDIELPTYICQSYLDKFKEGFEKYYECEAKNVTYDNYYEATKAYKDHIKDAGIEILSVYPVYYNSQRKIKKLNQIAGVLGNKILSFLIGQRQIVLRTVRPYPIDECENAVRISKLNMDLLGLTENDNVIIRNNQTSYKARVLLLDNYDILKNENRLKSEDDLSLLIAIPAYMRSELKLPYINSSVSVERDLKYLFRKNLNNQIMTIIGLLVSLSFINEIKMLLLKIVLIIFSFSLLLYLSFSEVREIISNK